MNMLDFTAWHAVNNGSPEEFLDDHRTIGLIQYLRSLRTLKVRHQIMIFVSLLRKAILLEDNQILAMMTMAYFDQMFVTRAK